MAVNRFAPETVSINVGQTVTWRDASPFMPHTVSFQPPFKSPDEPNAFLPVGGRSGARFAGGVAHSGILGPKPAFPADTFSLTFTKAGTYPYLCLLHPGMAGAEGGKRAGDEPARDGRVIHRLTRSGCGRIRDGRLCVSGADRGS